MYEYASPLVCCRESKRFCMCMLVVLDVCVCVCWLHKLLCMHECMCIHI